jgi:hypothetical protein
MEKIIDDLMIEYNKYIENNFKIGGIKMHQKIHQKMRKTKKSYKKKPYNKMRKTKKSIKHTL